MTQLKTGDLIKISFENQSFYDITGIPEKLPITTNDVVGIYLSIAGKEEDEVWHNVLLFTNESEQFYDFATYDNGHHRLIPEKWITSTGSNIFGSIPNGIDLLEDKIMPWEILKPEERISSEEMNDGIVDVSDDQLTTLYIKAMMALEKAEEIIKAFTSKQESKKSPKESNLTAKEYWAIEETPQPPHVKNFEEFVYERLPDEPAKSIFVLTDDTVIPTYNAFMKEPNVIPKKKNKT